MKLEEEREERTFNLKNALPYLVAVLIVLSLAFCAVLFVQVKSLREGQQQLNKQIDSLFVRLSETEAKLDGSVVANEEKVTETEVEANINKNTKNEGNNFNGDIAEDVGAVYPGKKVYLTFDDGPSVYTGEILDILKEHGAKATFFVCGTGDQDENLRPYYKRIVEEGHAIGMHSYSHVYSEVYYSAESFEYDLDKIRNLIYNETGVAAQCYRFPGGSGNSVAEHDMDTYIPILYASGLEYYDWNVYGGDASSKPITAQHIVENTLSGVDSVDEAVVVLHDTGAKKATVEALPEILDGLKERGCVLLTFDENPPVLHQYE